MVLTAHRIANIGDGIKYRGVDGTTVRRPGFVLHTVMEAVKGGPRGQTEPRQEDVALPGAHELGPEEQWGLIPRSCCFQRRLPRGWAEPASGKKV